VFFVIAGINHFRSPDFYVRMMPPYLPLHRELVWLSGVAEVVLGVLLLIPRTSIAAAWGLIALLAAVFPANVQMALHPETFPSLSPAALWLRLPLQGVLIAWAWWLTRPR
jgi:uncharacterized membrane protein